MNPPEAMLGRVNARVLTPLHDGFPIDPMLDLAAIHHKDLVASREALIPMETARTEFARELLRISDEERERFAREVHDELAQELFVLKILAESMTDPEAADLPAKARRLSELAARAEQTARALARGFDPILGTGGNFSEALHSLACRYENKVAFDFSSLPPVEIEKSRAAHLYRIVQEAVTNAIRHGGAARIRVALRQTNSDWQLDIEDDGAGFDPSKTQEGFGIRAMAYRAAELDGSLRIEKMPAGGMRVTCAFRAGAL